MGLQCKICGEEVTTDRHFYAKHKMAAADYYIKYYPRKDLWSKDHIPFKNKFQYFETYFTSPVHMAKWINSTTKEKFIEFLSIIIKVRHKRKVLDKPMGEAELQTLNNFPSLHIILKKISLEEYFKIYKNLGINEKNFSDYTLKAIPVKTLEIGIDTRENKPFVLENSRSFKMDYGDYTALGESFENVFVDRKACGDFISTFGGDIERFKKEIKRAADFDAYLVVLVENTVSMFKFGHTRLFNHTKYTPESVFHNVRELIQNNNNIQFLFAKSREEAKRCLPKILSYGKNVKDVDLQFIYEGGKL